MGTPAREKLSESKDGTVYRLSVEARRVASWRDAERAFGREWKHVCADGQFSEQLEHTPAFDRADPALLDSEHPAGTLFSRTLRCPSLPSYAFEFPRPLSQEEANDLMAERLPRRRYDGAAVNMILPFHESEHTPLHEQIRHFMGMLVQSQFDQCPHGIVFQDVSLGMQPRGTRDAGDTPAAYLAFVSRCLPDGAELAAPER